jgi:hypothetical protein
MVASLKGTFIPAWQVFPQLAIHQSEEQAYELLNSLQEEARHSTYRAWLNTSFGIGILSLGSLPLALGG